jgi:2-methylcitrate dehydratase PrpD
VKTSVRAPLSALADFVTAAEVPGAARVRAATAVLDTVGVALAGAVEPAARIVQATIGTAADEGCTVFGVTRRAAGTDAALANGTAAHALDYDDMCFVSLAHPSAPLVPAALAAGETADASGRAVLDAYVVGFEVQARLGRLMNPRHYARGWHCTSTLGCLSAAAAASRLLQLDRDAAAHALAIAASESSGLKENFGTMVKPLHAGLAARAGLLAALLAQHGMTASAQALDGPQGLLHAMDSEGADLSGATADLGTRWEILETGITVKLYPSCAGTHPALDALLDLRARKRLTADDVDIVDIDVDRVTPTVLIYDRPGTALEAKFSMPFCAAAALVDGRVGIDTFDDARLTDRRLAALMSRVTMRVDEALGVNAEPLTQARVRVRLLDGRTLEQRANGARGYPAQPATDEELATKFLACASRALSAERAAIALDRLQAIAQLASIRELTAVL